MDGVIQLAANLAILLAAGLMIGALSRRGFSLRWRLIALLLVAVNDLMLTRGYGLVPAIPGTEWNWAGKLLALAATLAIAALPAFGWRRVGLTLRQAPGSLVAALPVALLYCLFFLAIALLFPSEPGDRETIAFQLTMPGLEEEPFYRGLLLFAFDRAFAGRWRWLGVDWGWGALLSSLAFGLAHALSYSHGEFGFEPMVMALTAIPALLAVWLRLRTGSLLLPVMLHNFGNAIGLIV